jgi:plasmid stabilization system protein ParE
MQVIWTLETLHDRLNFWEYIAADNPRAGVHMDELFSAAAASLADFPDKGRLGTVAGTRTKKVTNLFMAQRHQPKNKPVPLFVIPFSLRALVGVRLRH